MNYSRSIILVTPHAKARAARCVDNTVAPDILVSVPFRKNVPNPDDDRPPT